jgi:DNA-binding response OmpR family regulator
MMWGVSTMVAELGEKRVIVVADDERLGRAIELNLASSHAEVTRLLLGTGRQRGGPETADLIVLALSSHRSNPVVALAQTALPHLVGQVPILIISEHPFRSDLPYRVHHLSFPFDPDQFCERVQALLANQSVPGEAAVAGAS